MKMLKEAALHIAALLIAAAVSCLLVIGMEYAR